MRIFLLCLALSFVLMGNGQSLTTVFESSGGKQTPTYEQVISWWKKMDAASPLVQMQEAGTTDAALPLHVVLVSSDKNVTLSKLKGSKKNVIFINNGIHPGEPDGIDASMLLVRDIAQGKFKLPSQVVLALIPVYNIGGALNRSTHYRVDQNGPEAFGFRGNAQNLDLNRDFIKCDSKEALSFTRLFRQLDPDIFIDNHVSNGADYQHVMTLLTSQHNKMGGASGRFLNQEFEPALYSLMKGKGFDLVPYVNHFGETPDQGWNEFWDSPRYSSGYTTLWNTFSFVPETHMLKPYPQRVAATRALMESFIEFTATYGGRIKSLRAEDRQRAAQSDSLPLAWKWDRTVSKEITFKGYQSGYKASEVSGQQRLFYDRSKPFEKKVPFYNRYVDTLSALKPLAYVIPQGWSKVIERLQANRVPMKQLGRDSSIAVDWYRIENYQSSPRPFEGHHLNSAVQVSVRNEKVNFRKGDYLIYLDGENSRFLMTVLEPHAEDSYFAWNFFDPILGQKEGFSDYVFEETAAAYLKAHPEVAAKLEEKRKADPAFAKNGRAQLNFIYQNSPYYEPAHLRYPVYRIMK